jgi:hypothetical protein
MPGRAGGSRGSAPNAPYLNEARPTNKSSEGLSGRRGAPTGAKVRGVTLVIFLMFLTDICKIFLVEALLLINPYKQYNQKIFRLSSVLAARTRFCEKCTNQETHGVMINTTTAQDQHPGEGARGSARPRARPAGEGTTGGEKKRCPARSSWGLAGPRLAGPSDVRLAISRGRKPPQLPPWFCI